MSELFTKRELQDHLASEVECYGGPRRWLRKHKITGHHELHMIDNGSAATLPEITAKLGYRKVTMYEPIPEDER